MFSTSKCNPGNCKQGLCGESSLLCKTWLTYGMDRGFKTMSHIRLRGQSFAALGPHLDHFTDCIVVERPHLEQYIIQPLHHTQSSGTARQRKKRRPP